jgi:hypothetical protein
VKLPSIIEEGAMVSRQPQQQQHHVYYHGCSANTEGDARLSDAVDVITVKLHCKRRADCLHFEFFHVQNGAWACRAQLTENLRNALVAVRNHSGMCRKDIGFAQQALTFFDEAHDHFPNAVLVAADSVYTKSRTIIKRESGPDGSWFPLHNDPHANNTRMLSNAFKTAESMTICTKMKAHSDADSGGEAQVDQRHEKRSAGSLKRTCGMVACSAGTAPTKRRHENSCCSSSENSGSSAEAGAHEKLARVIVGYLRDNKGAAAAEAQPSTPDAWRSARAQSSTPEAVLSALVAIRTKIGHTSSQEFGVSVRKLAAALIQLTSTSLGAN